MLGLIPSSKNLMKKNGMLKQLKLLKVDTMWLLRDLTLLDKDLHRDQPQLFLIIITELMLGLILSSKNLMKKNGMLKQLKLLKVDTMWLLRDLTLLDKDLHRDQPQLFLIIITELMLGLIPNTKSHTKKSGLKKHKK